MVFLIIKTKYMAAIKASKEALWLKGLVGTVGIMQNLVQIYSDSQSAYIRIVTEIRCEGR